MKTNYSVSIVIPFYNEEEYIPHTLKILDQTLCGKLDYEIILVNDGSTDQSLDIAERQKIFFKNVSVISLPENTGIGAALRAGFQASSKDYILYTDIDLPFDFTTEFERIYDTGTGLDLCYGHRLNKNESLKRRIYSKVFNTIINFFFEVKNPDINFAMKFIKRDMLRGISLKSNGSFIDCELYLKFLLSGLEMKAMGIYYQERIYGSSHLGNFKNIFKIAAEFLIIFPELLRMSQKFKSTEQLKA